MVIVLFGSLRFLFYFVCLLIFGIGTVAFSVSEKVDSSECADCFHGRVAFSKRKVLQCYLGIWSPDFPDLFCKSVPYSYINFACTLLTAALTF